MSLKNKKSQQQVISPVKGMVVSIGDVPDPVFAQKMVGDGMAIDPMGEVICAPITGKVIQFHEAKHAFTIQSPQGLEVLVHVGVNTVGLKGEGFEPQVQKGDRVEQGQSVLRFDLDSVAQKVKSVQVITVSVGDIEVSDRALPGNIIGCGSPLYVSSFQALEIPETFEDNLKSENYITTVNKPQGLHARPAAELVNAVKSFTSEVQIIKGDRRANAKSLTAIMALEVGENEVIEFVAKGPDSKKVIEVIQEVLPWEQPKKSETAKPKKEVNLHDSSGLGLPLQGEVEALAVAPGKALGPIYQLKSNNIEVENQSRGSAIELKQLDENLEEVKTELEQLESKLSEKNPQESAIFAAHRELIADPELLVRTKNAILSGDSATAAWQKAYTGLSKELASAKSEIIAGRAQDLRDIGLKVLKRLANYDDRAQYSDLKAGQIVLAKEVLPSQAVMLSERNVAAIVTVEGGKTSHVAILARSLGIPALVVANEALLDIKPGTSAIIDGDKGILHLDPSKEKQKITLEQIEQQKLNKIKFIEEIHLPTETLDKTNVIVAANLAEPREASLAKSYSAFGSGLIRTEFLFLKKSVAPTFEEEVACYSSVAELFNDNQPVVFRTLDVGGDKPLPYISIPKEQNPFLGIRGIRLSFEHETLFKQQLKALVVTAKSHKNVHIMFPMITDVEEFRRAKKMLLEICKEEGVENIPTGIMIEVPAAALMADVFAPEVDFFSIGTNDLTQYTLAMDRGHAQLAKKVDGLHPAVLNLISITTRAARKHNKWVGVCGGLAGQAEAIPLLVGLGVDELSVSVSALPEVKYQVRRLNKKECESMARRAILFESTEQVVDLAKSYKTHSVEYKKPLEGQNELIETGI